MFSKGPLKGHFTLITFSPFMENRLCEGEKKSFLATACAILP